MAETAVTLVIDKLVPLLIQEVKALTGIHKDVEAIKAELESMREFLRDADMKAEQDLNDGVKLWVKQLKEAAYRIEDVIDEYLFLVTSSEQNRQQCGVMGRILFKTRYLLKQPKDRRNLVSKIKDLKESVQAIHERGQRYHFSSKLEEGERGSGSSKTKNVIWNDTHVTSLFVEEAEVVGIESIRDELIDRLVRGSSLRTLISVVGMGGLGKTTLAKKVYDSSAVKHHFECNSWITVSQTYNFNDILHEMMRQFNCQGKHDPNNKSLMEVTWLISKLREHLQEKRYVIVFDDVWKEEFWQFIKQALPENDRGSRVLITTRIHNVAGSKSFSHHVHELKPLPGDQALKLFCIKAFQEDPEKKCPKEFETLSNAMVSRCEGLPLAIVTIAGLLSVRPKTQREWKRTLDGLNSEFNSNPRLTNITKILSFSYQDLPYYLKSCFLYLGLFPEDHQIDCGRLIRLWIAEGFIKEEKGKTVEDVAQEYLNELIHRSLIQVLWVDISGKAESCRIHDMMRNFIITKAKESNLCEILDDNTNIIEYTRCLSIQGRLTNGLPENMDICGVRSLLYFKGDEQLFMLLLEKIYRKFHPLKVLDSGNYDVSCIPEEMGNLYNLRYLRLRATKVDMLPKIIGKLLNLTTLDLRCSDMCILPCEIKNLVKLRHLYTSAHGVKVCDGFGSLQALQQLLCVKSDPDLFRELSRLQQLKELGITNVRKEYETGLCGALLKMSDLQSLSISSSEQLDLQMHPNSSVPLLLQHLHVDAELETFPNWISQLENLVTLSLKGSKLVDDALEVLQGLPHLLKLSLNGVGAYGGNELHFRKGAFKKLRDLRLHNMKGLERVIINKGAMPHLEELFIISSPQLKGLPLGIHGLKNLNSLVFQGVHREFSISEIPTWEVEEEYWKLQKLGSYHATFTDKNNRGRSLYVGIQMDRWILDLLLARRKST